MGRLPRTARWRGWVGTVTSVVACVLALGPPPASAVTWAYVSPNFPPITALSTVGSLRELPHDFVPSAVFVRGASRGASDDLQVVLANDDGVAVVTSVSADGLAALPQTELLRPVVALARTPEGPRSGRHARALATRHATRRFYASFGVSWTPRGAWPVPISAHYDTSDAGHRAWRAIDADEPADGLAAFTLSLARATSDHYPDTVARVIRREYVRRGALDAFAAQLRGRLVRNHRPIREIVRDAAILIYAPIARTQLARTDVARHHFLREFGFEGNAPTEAADRWLRRLEIDALSRNVQVRRHAAPPADAATGSRSSGTCACRPNSLAWHLDRWLAVP